MGTNGILNAEGDKDLIDESVIDIVKECVLLGVKDVFGSSVTVNTRRSSASYLAVDENGRVFDALNFRCNIIKVIFI